MTNKKRLWPFYSEPAIAAASDLIRRGETYASESHPAIVQLEANFLAAHGTMNRRALFMGSGTAALLAAYFSLDLPRESEVLVPVQTFYATVTPLLWLGLRPVLCDCDPVTGLLDLADAALRLTPRTRALVITHLWGQLVNVREARRFCDEHGLRLVEDCSHAHGARHSGVVSLADASAYSLGTKKIVSGGMGGMLITPAGEMYERAALITQSPLRLRELLTPNGPFTDLGSTGMGMNLRGSPLAAVLADDHVTRLRDISRQKNAVLQAVGALIADRFRHIEVAEVPCDDKHTLYALPMRVTGMSESLDEIRSKRNRLVERLRSAGFRAARAPAGLNSVLLLQRPELAPASRGLPFARTGRWTGSEVTAATGLRLDTRDMYEPWTSMDLDLAGRAFEQIAHEVGS